MVKYTEIHKAIVKKISSKVSDEIKITSEDITKGFERPSFFVNLDNIRTEDFKQECKNTSLTVRLYYFSKKIEKNKIELLDMQNLLDEIFLDDSIIKINEEISVEVFSIEYNTIDKVLHCYFDIEISENYNRIDNTPVVEDIDIEI